MQSFIHRLNDLRVQIRYYLLQRRLLCLKQFSSILLFPLLRKQ
nr:MAG TPA: hypothetical protein [Caudoviricetes sp.]